MEVPQKIFWLCHWFHWRYPNLASVLVLMYSWWAYKVARSVYLPCLLSSTVGTLAHQLPTYCLHSWADIDGNSHSFTVYCERQSTWPALETVDIRNMLDNRVLPCITPLHYITCAVTSCTHFDYNFVTIKKHNIILWHNAFNSLYYIIAMTL